MSKVTGTPTRRTTRSAKSRFFFGEMRDTKHMRSGPPSRGRSAGSDASPADPFEYVRGIRGYAEGLKKLAAQAERVR